MYLGSLLCIMLNLRESVFKSSSCIAYTARSENKRLQRTLVRNANARPGVEPPFLA